MKWIHSLQGYLEIGGVGLHDLLKEWIKYIQMFVYMLIMLANLNRMLFIQVRRVHRHQIATGPPPSLPTSASLPSPSPPPPLAPITTPGRQR